MANTKKPVKKSTENTLSDKYLRNILDNMLEGVQIVDPSFRYLYLNKAAVGQGKRKFSDELVGRTMMEMYPGIEKTELFKKIREALEKKVATYIENEFEFPDGSKGWFEIRIRPIPEGIFIISLDISERKKSEEELIQKKEDLEKFKRLTIGRELKMAELKEQIRKLTGKSEED